MINVLTKNLRKHEVYIYTEVKKIQWESGVRKQVWGMTAECNDAIRGNKNITRNNSRDRLGLHVTYTKHELGSADADRKECGNENELMVKWKIK